ncbi:MAG: ABC transporter permease subunit [Tissierellia bacterium]|jgi:ABC-2 type transport system permease protein|nr:ABC transporter permease subunit [Tissierellia bacterium]
MTTFRHEWAWHLKLLRGWLIAILGTLGLFLTFYPAFQMGMDDLNALLQGFPPEFLLGFGLDITTFGTYSGYMAYIYTFIQLLLGILSLMSGMYLLGREKLNRTSDFLFSKPISRSKLWLQKVSVGLIGLLLINGLIGLVIYGIGIVLDLEMDRALFQILGSSSLLQLIFFFLGALLTIIKKRVQSVTGPATSISFGFYFMLIIGRLLEDDKISRISLYGLFDPAQVQRNGIDQTNLLISLGLVFVLAGISYWRFIKMDLEV